MNGRRGQKRRISGEDQDAIIAALRPTVAEVMRQFGIAPTTVGKLATIAGQRIGM